MFRAKTVLVIGAGASVEVGLPMGPELLKQIVKLTHITFEHYTQKGGDAAILTALKLILNEGGEVTKINHPADDFDCDAQRVHGLSFSVGAGGA